MTLILTLSHTLSAFSGSVGLLTNILLSLLLSMLLGLVILSLNLSQIIERIIVYVCLWVWESSACTTLVLKNLSAHRVRNQHSSIMFALSTAFIVFLSTTADLQVHVGSWLGLLGLLRFQVI